ncbi:hypothetical protein [Ruegeria lacuscaerulensis]|uniref:hypothetical protein n=1 Tax=Ruegeria lacuscaerulensis TaxID=55218 RepID=UPI00147A9131|nr:hypothetical protein [Ruegeria lacuscaerulensis]
MARAKERITQADFGVGQVRPEAVERDDTVLIERSMRECRNTITLTTGALEIRPGLVHLSSTNSYWGVEVDLGSGRVYDLHIKANGLVLYNADGSVETSFNGVDWTSVPGVWGSPAFTSMKFWVVSDPDSSAIFIGSKHTPIYALVHNGTIWTLGQLSFATALNGAIQQPYYLYDRGSSIQPSARTGSITVTASDSIWTSAHAGMSIRYGGREITLDSLVSSTVMNATVVEELAPTYDLVVASSSGYQLGEAVEHSTLGGKGLITGISGNTITVLATEIWNGFAGSGNLVAPNASQAISSKTDVTPAASFIWDLQMQSPVHGYAGWAEKHKGRMYLCDFPGAPQSFAASVAGFVDDFTMGEADGDGFVETLGANYGGDLRFILSAEDLLFFTSRGLYYQQTRDGSAVTPRTIGPVRFSKIGCADVPPVAVDDGAIFVDSVGQQIHSALLDGDIYRSWRAANISQYHSQLINRPIHLGATASGSEWPEQFIFVTNSDGTVAVCQWEKDENIFGWRPWDTNGEFLAVYEAFGDVHAVVNRTLNSVPQRIRERFETGVYLDCTASLKVSDANPAGETGVDYFGGVTKAATHLNGETATVYFEGWDLGDRVIDAAGAPLDDNGDLVDYPDYDGILQIGLIFVVRAVPWPRRSAQTQRGKRSVKRTVKMSFTVQDTLSFTYEGKRFGGYRVNEDLTSPPPVRSQDAVFITGGRKPFEERALVVDRPGPFRLLKIKYRVTI